MMRAFHFVAGASVIVCGARVAVHLWPTDPLLAFISALAFAVAAIDILQREARP